MSKDVVVNGQALPKGTYSLWMEVQPTEWTVIFDTDGKAVPHQPPEARQLPGAVYRHARQPAAGPDMLTWSFTEVSAAGTTLRMAWAGKSVTLQIRVPGVAPPPLPADLAGRYTGNYAILFGPARARSRRPARRGRPGSS